MKKALNDLKNTRPWTMQLMLEIGYWKMAPNKSKYLSINKGVNMKIEIQIKNSQSLIPVEVIPAEWKRYIEV